ncbi:hypothetical protein ACFPM3_18120 [Streptomyces coeruleoprunus]|uniref:DNA polymerase Y-family little finger domain-containing protein n=1 Tax=Streptomyces coeruleoprunus TaxID=285563 RepID=A0ABV9XI73_9ACTN
MHGRSRRNRRSPAGHRRRGRPRRPRRTASRLRSRGPAAAPRSISASRRFDEDELDGDRHWRTVLALAENLGARLREAGEIAQSLTLAVTYADGSQTSRTPHPR